MQHRSTLLNSTFLDGVGLRGQTDATCCAVQIRIAVIRDLRWIMISNFRPIYQLSCLRDDCWACASATMLKCAAKRMQLCCSHMTTKEMLNDVAPNVWWEPNFVQHHTTIWCNMVAKRVQYVAFSNVEGWCWCWIGMLHQLGQGLSNYNLYFLKFYFMWYVTDVIVANSL